MNKFDVFFFSEAIIVPKTSIFFPWFSHIKKEASCCATFYIYGSKFRIHYLVLVYLGWWTRSASRIDLSMLSGLKNARKHYISLADKWTFTHENWGLPSIRIHHTRSCPVYHSLRLSGAVTSYFYNHTIHLLGCRGGNIESSLKIFYMQEIGVLVTLFILFHACVGLILPSLARLRTM